MSTNKYVGRHFTYFYMLRFVILTLFFCLIFFALSAQKHDYNWIYGYGDFTMTEPNRDGLWLNFSGKEVDASVFEKEEWFFLTSLSYSDAEGNLQLYSDGCAFYDEHGQLLENGEDLHISATFCDSNIGYPADQGMIALPTSDADIVSIFYNEEYRVVDSLGSRLEVRLLRAMVDIKDNIVLSKKEEVLDTLATKHSNGQDWWIMNQDYFSNEYKCVLVREGEVIDTVSSFIGNPVMAADAPQSNFSPNGRMFARFDPTDELQLYDFDRSTGVLSNLRFIDVPSTLEGTIHSGGLSFSGSSRFLYVNEALGIWQYDTQAMDIAASVVQVAEREVFSTGQDIFVNPIFTFFYRMSLAPDCRIYMSSRSGVDRIYVIMDPEQKGVACDVVQNLKIPAWNDGTTPHYPNYRLDTAPFCDSSKDFPSNLMTTVSTTEATSSSLPTRVQVYPNPAQDYCNVYLKNVATQTVHFVLRDLLGHELISQDISLVEGSMIEEVDLHLVPAGIYVYSIHDKGQVLYSDRLVISR
jgi:hypothetical protein